MRPLFIAGEPQVCAKCKVQVPMRFVVQKHAARHLQLDFRLERDGVYKSWAVPKGVPEKSGERRLAIQVDDHALEYGDFEGVIPEGQYGAGTVSIWDRGTYELIEWTDDAIVVSLSGKRLKGTYNLVRFRQAGKQEWLIFKPRNSGRGSRAGKSDHAD